jgi:SNF2 family DNA or RNA helicase
MAIKAPRRWVITATPMQNKFKEVQSLAHNIIGVPMMPMSEMLDEYYLRCVKISLLFVLFCTCSTKRI